MQGFSSARDLVSGACRASALNAILGRENAHLRPWVGPFRPMASTACTSQGRSRLRGAKVLACWGGRPAVGRARASFVVLGWDMLGTGDHYRDSAIWARVVTERKGSGGLLGWRCACPPTNAGEPGGTMATARAAGGVGGFGEKAGWRVCQVGGWVGGGGCRKLLPRSLRWGAVRLVWDQQSLCRSRGL